MKAYQKETIDTYTRQAKAFKDTRARFVQPDKLDQFQKLVLGDTVLDLGCGPGRDSAELIKRGFSVQGVDITQAFIDIARNDVPDAIFTQMDVMDLIFEDDIFDGIWASAVFLHLKPEDFFVALKEAYRVLKPGGIIRFSVKKGNGEHIIKDERLHNEQRFFYYYSKDEVVEHTQKVGFEMLGVIEVKPRNHPVPIEWIDVFAKKPL